MMRILIYCLALLFAAPVCQSEEDEIFSGPQKGEGLPSLPVKRVLVDEGGKIDLASDKPTLLVFVHQFTRPSILFSRTLMKYAAQRKKDGLQSGLIFLGDDPIATEARLQRAKHALPVEVPIAISLDGIEGPGSYGLNRDVTLTILVAKDKEVQMNLALLDPNIPVQLPKVVKAICQQVGGDPPPVKDLIDQSQMMARRRDTPKRASPIKDPKVESLLRQLIRKETPDEKVNELAKQIDQALDGNDALAKQVAAIAKRVHNVYGTERAKFHLRRWAGVKDASETEDK